MDGLQKSPLSFSRFWPALLLACVLAATLPFGADRLFGADPPSGATADAVADGSESKIERLWNSTGLHGFVREEVADDGTRTNPGVMNIVMIGVGLILIYLGIAKGFEPLLLIPIGFGGILANIPYAGIGDEGGFLYLVYELGIKTGLFPLLIFLGVGAMTDFGPLIANPKTALLGAAAQTGIFATLIGALWLSGTFDSIDFSIRDASAIGIIGGADGPTAIFLAGRLAPDLLGVSSASIHYRPDLEPVFQNMHPIRVGGRPFSPARCG